MGDLSETPQQRKYPQRNRPKVKYYEEFVMTPETPREKKNIKKFKPEDDSYSNENSSSEEDDNDENNEEDINTNEEISEYEKMTLKNMEENRRIMKELGLLNSKNEQKTKPKETTIKPRKRAPKIPREKIKRSLRLLKKTPDGADLPLTFEDSPDTSLEVEEKSRIEEESLPMNEDGTITDFLDSLKTSLSQDSSQSCLVSTDSLIQDMRNLEFAELHKVTKSRVQSMCVHPLEAKLMIVVGSSEGELGIWDVNDNQVACFKPHRRPINCTSVSAFNPCEIFTTSFDGTLRRADINKSTLDLVYQTDEKRNMCHITWHAQLDGNTMIVAHGTGQAGVVDLRTKRGERWFHCHPRSIRTIHIHPTQPNYFLTSSGTGECKIWDLRSSKKYTEESVSDVCQGRSAKGLTSAFFSPDGNRVVTTGNDDRIRIYDTSDITKPQELNSILHDNHTGRWLSVFKTIWHTHSSDLLFVGSMLHPRRIQMYSGSGRLVKDVMDEELTTVVSVISLHPTLPIVVGGNSTGKAHVFTTPQCIGRYFTR